MELVIFEAIKNNTRVISPSGWIDETNAEQLRNKLGEHLDKKDYKMILNLVNIAYVGTAGWMALLDIERRAKAFGGELIITGMSKEVHSFYTSMAFDEIIRSYDSEQEALESFRAN